MARQAQHDLTSGPILSRMLAVALPIMGTQFLQMCYNLSDMFWMGRVGEGAVAASGSGGLYLWLSVAFIMIGRMGAEIGVSQNMGRGDEAAARRYSQTALAVAAGLGALFGLLLIFGSKPLAAWLNIKDAAVASDTARYLMIVGFGIPATTLTGVFTGTFNGAGNSRISFWCNFVGLAVNVLLDPLMIFGFGWGIAGAAISTVIGQWIVCVLFMLAIKLAEGRPFAQYSFFKKPEAALAGQIFRWATPIGAESFLFTLLTMFVAQMVNELGTTVMAVQRVGSQVESLTWLVGGGFASAITAFVGQNYGAGTWTRIHKGFRISLTVMVCWGLGVTALLLFGGRMVYELFLPGNAEGIAGGVTYLKILSACQLLMCLEGVASGHFRGVGKTFRPSIASIASNLIRVPLAYYLGREFGVNGLWWALTSTAILRGAWIFVWYVLVARKLPRQDNARPKAEAGDSMILSGEALEVIEQRGV